MSGREDLESYTMSQFSEDRKMDTIPLVGNIANLQEVGTGDAPTSSNSIALLPVRLVFHICGTHPMVPE